MPLKYWEKPSDISRISPITSQYGFSVHFAEFVHSEVVEDCCLLCQMLLKCVSQIEQALIVNMLRHDSTSTQVFRERFEHGAGSLLGFLLLSYTISSR